MDEMKSNSMKGNHICESQAKGVFLVLIFLFFLNYKLNYWRILEVEILNYGQKLNATDYWRKLKGTGGLLNPSEH
jgi:hypothetical protein